MTKARKKKNSSIIFKRVISTVTAFTLLACSLPMSEISSKLMSLPGTIVAQADEYGHNPTLFTPNDVIEYSKDYNARPDFHYNDIVTISYSGSDSSVAFTGFQSIGKTRAFEGKLIIDTVSDHWLNIDVPMFEQIADNAEIETASGRQLIIKPTADSDEPVFAKKVVHKDGNNQTANWKVEIGNYNSENHKHGSVIGTLDEDAKVSLSVVNDYSAAVEGKTNAGVICETMNADSALTVTSISGSDMTSVTAKNGNAGGLVGEMEAGSTLNVNGASSAFASPTSTITAKGSDHYAGGLVGKNFQATVTTNNGYTAIKNTISGTAGAGGLFGYYKPILTSNTFSLDLDSYTIGDSSKKCSVSSIGGAGGFFGVLDNPQGGTITLSGSSTKPIYAKGAGNTTVFGGIIGTYRANSIDNSLFINGTSSSNKLTINTDKSNDLAYYGGVIGKIDGSVFASVESVSVNASNAGDEFFGGAVACADDGYVYVKDFALTASGTHGGGVVGHCANGVVHLAGATDLSGATSATESAKYGQIVGYRDSALVFADSSWNLTRSSSSSNTADDIGAWGEVVRFKDSGFVISDVLDAYYIPTAASPNHYATVKAAAFSGTKIALSDKATFARAALNMQLNNGSSDSTKTLRFADTTNSTYTVLKSKSVAMSADIDLSHTGMTGLTRDNKLSEWTADIGPEYSGSEFDGGTYTLTLAIGEGYNGADTTNISDSSSKGKIYCHRFNGLFGETSSAFTVKNVTITGKVHTYDRAGKDAIFYVGTIAGNAAAAFNATGVTVNNSTSVVYGTNSADDELYVGGLVGKMSAPGTSTIGSQAYVGTTNSTFSASITGNAANGTPYIGGVSGYVDGNDGVVNVYDVKISGSVTNSGTRKDQYIGGLFANAWNCTLNLDGVELNGLTVKGKMNSDGGATMGGLLGYNYLNTTSTFDNIKVLNCILDNDSSTGKMAGLVNMGSGYWKFLKVEIGGDSPSVNGITLAGSSAESFGMLVNRASSGESAMYLELPSGFTYKIYNVSGTAPAIYDEIAANTKLAGSIEENGNPIVSINTNGTTRYGPQTDTTVHMTSGTCNTYQNQVTATGFNKYNPNSRYYYNVDNYIGQSNSGAAALYLWSVYQYAHSTIQLKIAASAPSASFSGSLDLDGYSYYPVDVSGSGTVNIQGNVKLYNEKIENIEAASSGGSDSYARTTLKDTTNNTTTQHYLMHAGLFRNVSGTVNINGALSLNGTVPLINSYCGALVCGTIGGSTSSNATVTSNNTGASISLAGIKIHNKNSSYSPLLINKASTNVVLDIYNVSASGYSSNDTIATSLLGKVGSDTAVEVKVTFNSIELDARSSNTPSTLDTVYGTTKSLFTRATLLESLEYASGSGSYGVYNYEYSEDWNASHSHIGDVTYGKELTNNDSKNYGKEFWYYNENHASVDAHYVDPLNYNTTGNGISSVDFTGYIPYVAVWGSDIGTSTTKHQLNVNHAAATFGGCGTYNDPYKITDGSQLESIAKILSGDDDNGTFWLYYPDDTDQWCDNKDQHKAYRYYSAQFTTKEGTSVTPTEGTYYQVIPFTESGITNYYVTNASKDNTLSPSAVRKHLAGAYYYLDKNIIISASSGYAGLGSNSDSTYAFHGVIAGNDKTITNQSGSPLIYASNGCVVRNLKVVAENNSIALTGTASNGFQTSGGCGAYGAVIGRVFGGDNILDKVKVDVSSAVVTPTTVTPVGGYIGVIVEGGVFFRNMDDTNVPVADKTGFATTTVNNGTTVATIYNEDSKQYLYCNPLIGRVINGFAVTEASAYAPYEDGYRYFGSGTTPVSGNAVTLKNGNKNYSITDIAPNDKLTVSAKSFTVSSSQQFFVMSLIINSGIGTNGTNVVGYYGSNQMTRRADYSDVGTDVKKTDDGYASTNAWKDYQKAKDDDTANPYLLDKYATGTYAKQLGSESGFTINLNADIILPDGYKGIGNIYGTEAIINNNKARILNDNLQLALSNFNGNDHTISQNTTYYSYTKGNDNYLPYTHYSYVDKGVTKYNNNVHGLGLFNYVKNATYKECILTGNVKTRQYNTDGTAPNYIRSDDFTALAAGMFIGTLNMGNNATITDVYLQNTYTEGSREAAGLIGFLINGGKKISISNTISKSTQSNKIRVSAGTSAAGLIARQGLIDSGPSGGVGEIEIKLNGHQFDYVSIISRYDGTFEKDKWNSDWSLGVGGIVGIARAGTNDISATNNHITIEGVNIGKAVGDNARVVACEYIDSSGQTVRGNVYTGGLVGVANKAPIDATDCNIYNVTVSSANYSGGVLGWGGTWSNINLDNFTIKNTLNGDNAAKIISNSTGNAGCVVGFCKGGDDKQSMGSLKINDSIIEGYTVEAGYAGSALGDWNSSKPFSINNSIVNNCTINYYAAGGGLAGQLKQSLNGYNVRVSEITFTKKGDAETTYRGYIAGKRDGGTIKIVGFQRTGTISEPKLVGNNTNNVMSDMYGSAGYVVFADYEGKSALDPPNTSASSIGTAPVAAASPYITVNPALTLNSNINKLTGDGISITAVNSILTDDSDKKYQVKASSSSDAPRSYFITGTDVDTNTVSNFNTELGEVITGEKYNFPMLVIDDPDDAETDVNKYLQMLTNTTIDFSNSSGLKVNSNAASTNVGTVTIYKCAYSNGTYTLTSNDACLVINGDSFGIRQTNGTYQYDTANLNGQFTLIDVAFKDPSSSNDVAYHLYVPVIVKKLLEYNFDIGAASGTTYDQSLYSNRGKTLLENLGTPVTMEFEYTYQRTRAEWNAETTNNATANDYNYNKYISVSSSYGTIDGTTTKAVLVDINRGGKVYYLDSWNAGLTDGKLDLQKFKDSDNTYFTPMNFSELITAQGITGDQYLTEKYYISIFTESGTNDMFHYVLGHTDLVDGEHPARRVNCEDQKIGEAHYLFRLFMGDFYSNSLIVTTTNGNEEISKDNKQIGVNLIATVDIKDSATRDNIKSVLNYGNINIYESLLVSFQNFVDGTIKERGIKAIDSWEIAKDGSGNYLYSIKDKDNIEITIEQLATQRLSNGIEFQNNTDISQNLAKGVVTISATVLLNFDDEDTQKAQFPFKAEGSTKTTGSRVQGYSNISSNKDNTAYSTVSADEPDSYSRYYYCATEESADLTYSADYMSTDDRNQLGVNGREIESKATGNTISTIYTVGRYDATGLINADKIQYIKCKVELLQKDSTGKYQNVAIATYLDNLSVNAGETVTYSSTANANQYEYVFSKSDVAQFQNEPNVYKIPIVFDVITGNKTGFANTLKYANYQVKLTVSAFDTDDSSHSWADANAMNKSSDSDFVIYTNARIYTDLIKQAS